MDDDFENMCPLCVLPFNEQDMLFRPCACGFRICSWCWHKIVDDAGQAGESTVDTIAKCPNCREPFDVAATLEQQSKNQAIIAEQNKARPKRKAVPAKQGVVDNVYVDGKSVVLRNVPSDTFFPVVLRRIRDRHIQNYENELAAAHGGADTTDTRAATSAKEKSGRDSKKSNNDDVGLVADLGEDGEDNDCFDNELVADSSDEEDGRGVDDAVALHGLPSTAKPFPFAFVPPCRNKKDLAEVVKTLVMADYLASAEDEELTRLIVERRNDFPYQHVYSSRTDRLEHHTPYIVAPTLEHLQHVVGVPHVEGSLLPSSGTSETSTAVGGGGSGARSSTHLAEQQQHSPLLTGYPPRAPTLGRPQLALFSRYESDLWSWVEHFLSPAPAPAVTSVGNTTAFAGGKEDVGEAPEASTSATTTVTSSVPYWNHSFFDTWVPADGSSRAARRALLLARRSSPQSASSSSAVPLLPPALEKALLARNLAEMKERKTHQNKLNQERSLPRAMSVVASPHEQKGTDSVLTAPPTSASSLLSKPVVVPTPPDNWEDDDAAVIGSSANKLFLAPSSACSQLLASSHFSDAERTLLEKEYKLLRAVAAPPLLSIDDTLACLTVEQVVADLPELTYTAVEALVSQAITAHKVRGQGPTAVGGFVSAAAMAQFGCHPQSACRTNSQSTTSSSSSAPPQYELFPSPAAILSSVLVILLHRRRLWYRWITELVAAADSCVRDTVNTYIFTTSEGDRRQEDTAHQLRLQHLLPPALRQQQRMLSQVNAKLKMAANSQQKSTTVGSASTTVTIGVVPTPECGILNRGGSLSSSVTAEGSAAATTTAGGVGLASSSPLSYLSEPSSAEAGAWAEENSSKSVGRENEESGVGLEGLIAATADLFAVDPLSARQTSVPSFPASKAYLLTFGIALINYLGLKEAVCLTDADRLRYLRSYASVGRYGTITDMEMELDPADCQLLLNVVPDTRQIRKALQHVAETFNISPQQQGHGHGSSHVAATVGGSATAGAMIDPISGELITLKKRKWPEDLMRTMLFLATPKPTNAAEAVLLTQSNHRELSASSSFDELLSSLTRRGQNRNSSRKQLFQIPLLPCQYYSVALRFNAVSEAVQCVLKGSEELFPSWLGYAGLPSCTTAEVNSNASSGSNPNLTFWVSPQRSILFAPRRPAVIGLVPTRYCGSYLKHAPCKKQLCVELHADISGKNAIMLTSTTAQTLVKNIQKHFFTPYLEAEGTLDAAVFGADGSAVGQQAEVGGGSMVRQNSSACYYLLGGMTGGNGSDNINNEENERSLLLSASASLPAVGSTASFERQGSSVVFGAAAAAASTVRSSEVKSIAPLHLKMIKAGDISTFGGDLLVPSPLLVSNTASSSFSPSSSANPSASATTTKAPLKVLMDSITAAFAGAVADDMTTNISKSDSNSSSGFCSSSSPSRLASSEAKARRMGINLLVVASAIIDTLLGAPSKQNNNNNSMNTGNSNNNNTTTTTANNNNNKNIAFITLQLASLSQQCAAGAVCSPITRPALFGQGGGVRGGEQEVTNIASAASPTVVHVASAARSGGPAAWIGLEAVIDNVLKAKGIAATANSEDEKEEEEEREKDLAASFRRQAEACCDLLFTPKAAPTPTPAPTTERTRSVDERRALLLSLLPDVTHLLHLHIGALLARINEVVSDSIHDKTLCANHSHLLGINNDSSSRNAAASAPPIVDLTSTELSSPTKGNNDRLTIMRNSSNGIIFSGGISGGTLSALQQLMAANNITSSSGSGATSNVLSSALSSSSAPATLTPEAVAASLAVAVKPSAIPESSELLTALQTTTVVLIRILQILRQLSDVLALSATLFSLNHASNSASTTTTATGGGQQQQGQSGVSVASAVGRALVATSETGGTGDTGTMLSQPPNANSSTTAAAGLLAAKTLLQRANFVRTLVASLQLFIQASPKLLLQNGALSSTKKSPSGKQKREGKAREGAGKDKEVRSSSRTNLVNITTSAKNENKQQLQQTASSLPPMSIREANQKTIARLALEHHKTLLQLPAHLNLVPNTEDKDILVGTSTTVCITYPSPASTTPSGGYGHHHHHGSSSSQQHQQVLPGRYLAVELCPADQLGSHQHQIQCGVTPSTALSTLTDPPFVAQAQAIVATAARGAPLALAVASSNVGNNTSSSSSLMHVSRSKNAGNSIVTLAVRRAKRTRRQLINALEMWSVFVPSVVLDCIDNNARNDFLHNYNVALAPLLQEKLCLLQKNTVNNNNNNNNNSNNNNKGENCCDEEEREGEAEPHHYHNDACVRTPQEVIRHALTTLVVPHQFAAATRYFHLCSSVSTKVGTSGVAIGASSFSPNSVLTCGDVLRSSRCAAVDAHGATAESRAFVDGLARLRVGGTSMLGELTLFQQLGSPTIGAIPPLQLSSQHLAQHIHHLQSIGHGHHNNHQPHTNAVQSCLDTVEALARAHHPLASAGVLSASSLSSAVATPSIGKDNKQQLVNINSNTNNNNNNNNAHQSATNKSSATTMSYATQQQHNKTSSANKNKSSPPPATAAAAATATVKINYAPASADATKIEESAASSVNAWSTTTGVPFVSTMSGAKSTPAPTPTSVLAPSSADAFESTPTVTASKPIPPVAAGATPPNSSPTPTPAPAPVASSSSTQATDLLAIVEITPSRPYPFVKKEKVLKDKPPASPAPSPAPSAASVVFSTPTPSSAWATRPLVQPSSGVTTATQQTTPQSSVWGALPTLGSTSGTSITAPPVRSFASVVSSGAKK